MAPWFRVSDRYSWSRDLSYRLTGNIWMPYLGGELHYGRLERVFVRYRDGDLVRATLVGSAWWSGEGTFQVGQAVAYCLGMNLGQRVGSNIGQLFGYPPGFVAGHDLKLNDDVQGRQQIVVRQRRNSAEED